MDYHGLMCSTMRQRLVQDKKKVPIFSLPQISISNLSISSFHQQQKALIFFSSRFHKSINQDSRLIWVCVILG
ncbi:hypothetical protein L6452_35324 [Arctium lappa]|uniref:Uncharacterized protein n=1 Tax=Arctium lappa TaxID=4217 RepID=A0ACB8Y6X0_ARCLA|nr:hypothetical protein L6452_35324 [Arctium lappa]